MTKKKLVVLLHILLIVNTSFALTPTSLSKRVIEDTVGNTNLSHKTQLRFAAFTDTHIGAKYQYPYYKMAGHLDLIGKDLIDATNTLDFAIHLGDIVNRNTAHVNGGGLPWYVNQYKNNLKAYLISNINLPFHCVLGNHDINDYEMNRDDPHNLTRSLIDELSMNNPVYAMMRDGILFLVVPELGYITWTHPVEYEWIEYMTRSYPHTTTIILSHQAIEDTTKEDIDTITYCGKQDRGWWAHLFQNNPQIKMWIHGHTHCLDWYVSNQSTGDTYPIQKFGHEIAFSAPYSQLDWGFHHEEDRIVIYTITPVNITTITWENNGNGGHWKEEYVHTWNVPTTLDPNSDDWYSFPMFLQDNETQLTDLKVLSPHITLQLIGTDPIELFYDPLMESPSGHANEIILGFGNDRSGNVEWTNPGMRVHGPTSIVFPEKNPYSYTRKIHEDGRSGQPYHSFPMGTICAAIPGQTYNFTITARCISGNGNFTMNVSCSDWSTKSQYSELSNSEHQVFSHMFGETYEIIHGTYTVPDNQNAWFLQGTLDFLDTAVYDLSLFSVKRERTSDTTDDFHLCLSDTWYNVSGTLDENEAINFSVDPKFLSDSEGVMNFTTRISGNRYGMVNIVFREPVLLTRNTRFRVNSYSNNVFNLSLTKTISRNSPVFINRWVSELFQRFPVVTELVVRFLMKSFNGKILDRIISNDSVPFKIFPFSTDSIYEELRINAKDGSGVKHVSCNGNIWFSCNSPQSENLYVEITLPR